MNIQSRIVFLAGALALTIASVCGAAFAAEARSVAPLADPQLALARAPLSLPALEKRLRDTRALSVFGKLELRSEIDALMARFRLEHAGQGAGMNTLRLPFDTLVTKIRVSLRRNDPQLAREIANAREAIWAALTDRSRFPA